VKKFLLKICAWFALKCRLYYFWSRVYRFLYERKYKNVQLPYYGHLKDLEKVLGEMIWIEDDWTMLWDAISTPQATYQRHVDRQDDEDAGDCDDISLFAANRIYDRGSILRSDNDEDSYLVKVGLLSCPWISAKGKAGGHNVCAFQYMELKTGVAQWAHVSNWHNGKIQWGFNSLYDVVSAVVGRKKCTSLGWAFASINLKLQEYHWSL
jgi:hypothetical protein